MESSAPTTADSLLRDLLNGRVQMLEFSGGNVFVDAPRAGRVYLPGSFNPLHGGHQDLLQVGVGVQGGGLGWVGAWVAPRCPPRPAPHTSPLPHGPRPPPPPAQAALRLRPGAEGCFELSIGNADKGVLALEEVQRRVSQFVAAGLPLAVTQAPLFTQKGDLFPRSTFVVGYDTGKRAGGAGGGVGGREVGRCVCVCVVGYGTGEGAGAGGCV